MTKEIDIISIYKDILLENRNRFPLHTWLPENDGFITFKRCYRFLVFDELKLSRKEIINNCKQTFFSKYKLYTPMNRLFKGSPFNAITFCVPELEIQPWELKIAPDGTWTDDNIKAALRWLINGQLEWKREDILSNLSYRIFAEYSFSTLIHKKFNNLFELVNFAFPEYQFSPDDFRHVKKSN